MAVSPASALIRDRLWTREREGDQGLIVGDWGTTRLRLFRWADGKVADERLGPGVGALAASPADALLQTLGDWRAEASKNPVIICGMAGSNLGLAQAPYLPCPAVLSNLAAQVLALKVAELEVRIIPGLRCENFSAAPDVLRGEETQMLGALQLHPDLARGDRLLVLPGTHSKWARLHDGRVERFHTFLTGELFAHLRRGTTLIPAGADPSADPEGYAAGVERAGRAEPLGALFTARAAQLIAGRSPDWALGFISGLLIGGEIREALRLTEGTRSDIAVVGDPTLGALYRSALEPHGRAAVLIDGDEAVLAGLAQITRAEGSR